MQVISGKTVDDKPCQFYMDGYLLREMQRVKDRVLRKNWDYVAIVSGIPGCLTGNTIIRTNRASLGRKHTLKWMFNQYHNGIEDNPKNFIKWDLSIPTYVRSFDGNIIKLHKINDVTYSGKQKVYKLILEDGKNIKATSEHKIMTDKGMIELKKLNKEKDLVMCDTPNTSKSKIRFSKPKYLEISGLKYHPHQRSRKRVALHRLIYEAHINNLDLIKFIEIVSQDKDKASKFKYISEQKVVHHIDGNTNNNDITNLKCITQEEHKQIHANYKNFNQGIPIFVKIKNISYCGEEDVYDICCDEPFHNFSANEIIVSNSGKSTFVKSPARFLCPWFDINYFTFTDEEFIKVTTECPEYSAVALDESFQSLNSRVTWTPEFLRIVNHLQIIRQKHLFIFLCLPNFFDLAKGLSIFRSSHLFLTYANDKGQRGNFAAFDRKRKVRLFVKGQKYMDYDSVKANFIGRFAKNNEIIPEDIYEQKKLNHLLEEQKKLTKKKPAFQFTVGYDEIARRLHLQGLGTIKIAKILGKEQRIIEKYLKKLRENTPKTSEKLLNPTNFESGI